MCAFDVPQVQTRANIRNMKHLPSTCKRIRSRMQMLRNVSQAHAQLHVWKQQVSVKPTWIPTHRFRGHGQRTLATPPAQGSSNIKRRPQTRRFMLDDTVVASNHRRDGNKRYCWPTDE